MEHMSDERVDSRPQGRALEILWENHQAFLRFLERRVGSRDAAEDILQEAFTRTWPVVDAVPEEALIPWFYRTLRHAAIDRYRRRATTDKALEAFAKELESSTHPTEEVHREICACIGRLATALKPGYAAILDAVEVQGTSIKAFAGQHGVSPGNAAVRAFRAREALRTRVRQSCGVCAEHGCVDCTCRGRPDAYTAGCNARGRTACQE
jgi:RNA polymerase sigma factor (sigma-70 family)